MPRSDSLPQHGNPRRPSNYTLYTALWRELKERVQALPSGLIVREIYVRLLESFENAWAHVSKLQSACNAARAQVEELKELDTVFIDVLEVEIVERFRNIAFTSMESAPRARGGRQSEFPTDEIDAELQDLSGLSRILILAAQHPDTPAWARDTVPQACDALVTWTTELEGLLRQYKL